MPKSSSQQRDEDEEWESDRSSDAKDDGDEELRRDRRLRQMIGKEKGIEERAFKRYENSVYKVIMLLFIYSLLLFFITKAGILI